jgi:O-acetyl-ADP-ribose deacetylase (regulator of RNase III)
MKNEFKIKNATITLWQGDITDLKVDAIVNAANAHLKLGSGVAGAIRQKGGPSIQEECDRIGSTYVGGAVLTGAGNLAAKYIIHAVGPHQGEGEEEIKLRNATMNSLLLAEEYQAESLAFPAISTGIFGYPVDKCAQIMLKVTTEFLKRSDKIKHITFALWDTNTYKVFLGEMERLMVKIN